MLERGCRTQGGITICNPVPRLPHSRRRARATIVTSSRLARVAVPCGSHWLCARSSPWLLRLQVRPSGRRRAHLSARRQRGACSRVRECCQRGRSHGAQMTLGPAYDPRRGEPAGPIVNTCVQEMPWCADMRAGTRTQEQPEEHEPRLPRPCAFHARVSCAS